MSQEPPRSIPDPGFAGDDGAPDQRLVDALSAYDGRSGGEVLIALQDARLLVPVVAVLGEVEDAPEPGAGGLAREKTSDMATVLLAHADGRTGLLAFSGIHTLTAWRADARPVPVAARTAAQAALQDGADAVVIDVAGPRTFAVEGQDLRALASGWRLTWVGPAESRRTGWIRPAQE
jgi:hypothetical protein